MTTAGAHYAIVTDEALEKLASVANIKKRDRFKEAIRALIRDIWRTAHLVEPEAVGSLGWERTVLALIALEKSFAELVTAARDLRSSMEAFLKAAASDAIDSKETQARRDKYLKHLTDLRGEEDDGSNLDAVDHIPIPARLSTVDFLHVLECVSFLAQQPSQFSALPGTHPARSPGRPESVLSGLRRFFVQRLTSLTKEAGGKLTFNKNYETNGTDALGILAPYLPPRLIPQALPLSTLAQYYQEGRRR
jgi:hypothetical protein